MYTCAYSTNRYDSFFLTLYMNQVIYYWIMTSFMKRDKLHSRKMPFILNSENWLWHWLWRFAMKALSLAYLSNICSRHVHCFALEFMNYICYGGHDDYLLIGACYCRWPGSEKNESKSLFDNLCDRDEHQYEIQVNCLCHFIFPTKTNTCIFCWEYNIGKTFS